MKSIVKRIVTKIKVLHPKFRRGRIGLVRGVWNLISNQASLVWNIRKQYVDSM